MPETRPMIGGAEQHELAGDRLVFGEESSIGIARRGLAIDALTPQNPPLLVGDPEGIDFGNPFGLYAQHLGDTGIVEAMIAQVGLHAIDHSQQGEIDVPGSFGDIRLKQVGQVAGGVVDRLGISFPTVLQALDANGENDGVDQQDECQQPAPEVRVGGHGVGACGRQDRVPWWRDNSVTDYTFCRR